MQKTVARHLRICVHARMPTFPRVRVCMAPVQGRLRVGTVNFAEPQAVEKRRAAIIAATTPVDMMTWNMPKRFSNFWESAAHFMALPVWSSSINTACTDQASVSGVYEHDLQRN